MAKAKDTDPGVLVQLVGDTNPTLALSAVGALRVWLDEVEGPLVSRARDEGHSWHGIATALRRTKQGVWEKYRNPADSSDNSVNG